jgi:hypothetical protein
MPNETTDSELSDEIKLTVTLLLNEKLFRLKI